MRKLGAWMLAGAVLISLCGTACSKRENSKPLAAIESAYKAGLLTKAEYDAKKAALEPQSPALAALDKAFAAGIFTAEEYQVRKERIAALGALEKARGSGVLTNQEYAAKKAAIMAGNAPAPAVDSVTPSASPSAATPEPTPVADPVPVPAGAVTEAPVPPSQPQAASAASDPQGHSYRMKVVKITDAQGFERPYTSVSMLVPVDWQMQGATTWNIKDSCNTIHTALRGSGPDGRAYELFPAFNWVWADDPKFQQQIFAQKAQQGTHACDVMPPMSAQDYLRRNIPKIRPSAQLVGFEPAPKFLEMLQQTARQTEQSARQYNLTQQVKTDAIKARVRYTQDGKPMEEWIIAGVVITGTRAPALNIQTMQQEQKWTYSCVAYMGAERAPQGQLDANLNFFELINSTYRANPEWQAKVSGNAQAMQQIELKGIRDRSAIVAKSADDTRIAQRQIYENQSKSEEHTSTQFSQYQRGVESYRNPSTGETVDLDNNYGHAWVNNKGEYLLSDQAGFDPNSIFKNNEGWKPLDHVKK